MATRMQQRRATAAQWTQANPVLSAGEIGVATDTGVVKVGDGTKAWNALTIVLTGSSDAASLTIGNLDVARIPNNSLSAAKLNFDVATQSELDAVSSGLSSLSSAVALKQDIAGVIEAAQDALNASLVGAAHVGISFAYDDPGNKIVATVTGGGGSGGTAVVTRTPEQFGAIGDGVADDTTALEQCWAAIQAGETILLTGRYRKTRLLALTKDNVTIDGRGKGRPAEIYSTNRNDAALRFIGRTGTRIFGLRHVVAPYNGTDNGGNGRGNNDSMTAPFYFEDCTGLYTEDLYAANGAQCGFYSANVNGFTHIRPIVDRSYADGFHMTHNCRNGLVVDPLVQWPGDDGVAVVSYLERNPGQSVAMCSRITIINAVVRHSHARGVTVVGGEYIRYINPDVQWTRAAGGMMASESGYNTHGVNECYILGGSFRHIGYPTISSQGNIDAALDHGPLFFLSQQTGRPVENSAFRDCRVSDLGEAVYTFERAVINGSGTFNNCRFERTIVEPGVAPNATWGNLPTGVTASNRIDARPPSPVFRRLDADITRNTITTEPSGLGWNGILPGKYEILVEGTYTTADANVGLRLNWGFDGNQSAFDCIYEIATSATAVYRDVKTATNSEAVAPTSGAALILPFRIRATVVVTATAVFDLKFGAEVAGTNVTMRRGTAGQLTKTG